MMEKEKEGERSGPPCACGVDISVLPEGCISNTIALTTPKDACRACAVSSIFRAAAESNAVWESFLPSDYQAIIAQSSSSSDSLSFSSKKQLYLSLSDNPILIDDAKKQSFFLDKLSGKKCYLLSARELTIAWGDDSRYWRWISLPESRFSEIAKLSFVCWFDINGKMSTSMLSPKTNYAAYLVYKLRSRAHGFKHRLPTASIGTTGGGEVYEQTVGLGLPAVEPGQQDQVVLPQQQHTSRPKQRNDGWLEIELGQFFNEGGEADELQFGLKEVKCLSVKSGLIVEGIEIRPTRG
ncbi:F-box protein PP2-B10-like isoform X5 [Quercus robur]|uniref:F-box protein PP2-B10-like isoform X5 n=1 Tax=Quercus robur TaxID=38942 RepID=UPI002162145F|nr:F-box protein PP2-B10-like isoform X5 [Quercus robur]